MRVVLDPNVLVSAAISPAGPPRQILTAWTNERFDLIVAPPCSTNSSTSSPARSSSGSSPPAIAVAFIDGLAADATVLTDPPELPSISPDSDDDYLIALARDAAADYLVSGDRHLLALTDLDPPVLTPRQFLELLDT